MQLACILNQSLHVTNHGGQAVSKHNVNLVFMTCYQTLVPPPLPGLESSPHFFFFFINQAILIIKDRDTMEMTI